MTLQLNRDASPEEQIAQAAKYAGVSPATLDGIWNTETGRGSHKTMVGPATKWGTAKGHFQQLDSIVETFSKRLGRKLDPFNFSDGLTMAAMQLKENMERYRDEDSAVLAYHGGTDQRNWGPQTRAYLQKVRGTKPGKGNAATLAQLQELQDGLGKKAHLSADALWDIELPEAADTTSPTSGDTGLPATNSFGLTPGAASVTAARLAGAAKDAADFKEKDERAFWGLHNDSVFGAAVGKTLNPYFRFMAEADMDMTTDRDWMLQQRNQWAKVVEGYDQPHEQDFLLSAVNANDLQLRKHHLDEQRQNDKVLGEAGAAGMGAQFLAGAIDPMTYVAGIGAMKAMYMTGKGALALANQGRLAAAVGSSVVENAIGNVSYDILLNAMGEHRSLEDYGMSAALGLLPAALSYRGLHKTAVAAAANKHIKDTLDKALKEQTARMEQVAKDLGPNATKEDILLEMRRREADAAAQHLDDLRGEGDTRLSDDITVRDPEADLAAGRGVDAEVRGDGDVPDLKPDTQPETKPDTKPDTQPEAKPDAQPEGKPRATDRLPEDLRKADPRYSYGDKRFKLEFASDIDRAAYIAAGAKPSKRDADFVRFVSEALGISEAEVRKLGQAIREHIKGQAKDAAEGGSLSIKKLYEDLTGKPAKPGKAAHEVVLPWKNPETTADVRGAKPFRQFLEAVAAHPSAGSFGRAAKYLLDRVPAATWEAPTVIRGKARANVRMSEGRVTLSSATKDDPFTVVHEAVHVATINAIEAWRNPVTRAQLGPSVAKAVKRLETQYNRLKKEWERENGRPVGKDPADHIEYALKDLHEFAAQAISSQAFQRWLAGKPGKASAGPRASAWRDFLTNLKDILGIQTKGDSALDEALENLDALLARKDTTFKGADGTVTAYAPKQVDPIDLRYGLDMLPAHTPLERMQKKYIRELYRQAEAWAEKNPRNDEAVKALQGKVGMLTPATLIAQSDNPLARWVSAQLLEQTMGAHGRGTNAAIAAHMLNLEYVGDFTHVFDNAYTLWRNERVGLVRGVWDDVTNQKYRSEFNREVALEVERRGNPLYQGSENPYIRKVVDNFEKKMEHMAQEQRRNQTPGFAGLPESSRGYMPHLLDSAKLASLTDSQLRIYRDALKEQFINGAEDMDPAFAEKVANLYLDHARKNANGLSEIPAHPANVHAAEYVEAALKAGGMTAEEIHKFREKLSRGAASHTKRRLKFDTTRVYKDAAGNEFRLMDLFRTDMNDIMRGYARRVAGEVALTRFGVQGSQGLKLLHLALAYGGDKRLSAKQMEAVTQTFSELLGRPVNGKAEGQLLNGLMTYTSLNKLGGMGIMQVSEYGNVAISLGVGHTLSALGAVPRLRREIKALMAGDKSGSPLLSSMEQRGGAGEFGLEGYRMISGFDTTGRAHEAYGQATVGPVMRLLKRAGYALGVASMHRAVQSVQQRGVAEQIVLKTLRMVKNGGDDVFLRDAGFTPELIQHLRDNMDLHTVWNGNRVQSFDITKLPDPKMQAQFQQALHRGVYQTIQGTFIGERGWWVHNDTARFLTQFRNYPITAMEKQWGRTRVAHGGGIRGTMVAGMMVIAAAGMALPVYAARVALNAMNRDDSEEYIDKMLSPMEITKNIMNYISLTGMMQDVVSLMFSTAGAVNEDWKFLDMEKGVGRPGTGGILDSIPGLGMVEQLSRLPGQTNDPHKIAKALPYSNLPFLVPFVNMLRGD